MLVAKSLDISQTLNRNVEQYTTQCEVVAIKNGRAVTCTHNPAVTYTQKFLVTYTHAHA